MPRSHLQVWGFCTDPVPGKDCKGDIGGGEAQGRQPCDEVQQLGLHAAARLLHQGRRCLQIPANAKRHMQQVYSQS